MAGDWGGHLPAIYGHEAAGVITAVGSSIKGYSVVQELDFLSVHAMAYLQAPVNP